MNTLKRLLLPVFAFLAASLHAVDPVNTNLWGVAVKGFDVVAYFKEGKPVEGSSQFVHTWMDAKWRFSTEENRAAFAAEPERYAPQFGGYCAWAVSQGYTAGIDPEAWRIVDDKLYLNYSPKVQERWAEDIAGNVAKARKNWPDLLKK